MKLALDSCVAFKWVVAEVDTTTALRLRDDYRNAVHDADDRLVKTLQPQFPFVVALAAVP
jgi:hypothetical protein